MELLSSPGQRFDVRRERVTTATDGTYNWTFPTPFAAGVVPRIWGQCVTGAGILDVLNVQTEGAPTNVSCNIRVARTQRSVVALIGLTILSIPATIGATQVDLFAITPAD